MGFIVVTRTLEQTAATVGAEVGKRAQVIKASNIKPD